MEYSRDRVNEIEVKALGGDLKGPVVTLLQHPGRFLTNPS